MNFYFIQVYALKNSTGVIAMERIISKATNLLIDEEGTIAKIFMIDDEPYPYNLDEIDILADYEASNWLSVFLFTYVRKEVKNKSMYISDETLASETGVSVNIINILMGRLVRKGLIIKTGIYKREDGDMGFNYTIPQQ